MNSMRVQRLVLHVRVHVARFGSGNSICCILFFLGCILWLWVMPRLHNLIEDQQQAIAQAQIDLRAPVRPASIAMRSLPEQRLSVFYDHLGEHRFAEQQIKTLFAIAEKNGLVLSQGEYRSAFDQNGRFYTYQASLPVKGSYQAIRQFCEQTLLAIPFASLDDMNFKRESISNARLEAKLRFTLYLSQPGKTTAAPLAANSGSNMR